MRRAPDMHTPFAVSEGFEDPPCGLGAPHVRQGTRRWTLHKLSPM
jgi:hypothetical protein